MSYTLIDSPVGPLTVGYEGTTMTRLAFGEHHGAVDDGAFPAARTQLTEYFAGARTEFDLDLAPAGTEFQQRVWAQLRRIPHGQTQTYGQVATAIGANGAHSARAVGSANHNNQIAIVIPCHRVIGADGKLVGFAGGLDTKRRLLDLEAGRLAML